MTSIAKEVGHRIRKIREEQDHNQQSMADELGITAGAYAKIERGETDPSISRLHEIAKILKTDVISLIKEYPASVDVYTQLTTLAKEMEMLKKEMAAIKKSASKKK